MPSFLLTGQSVPSAYAVQPHDVIGHLAAGKNPPADVLSGAGDGPQRLWELALRDSDEAGEDFPDGEGFDVVPPQNPQDAQSQQDTQVPEDVLGQQAVDLERVGGAIETTKEMILLMRLANMLGMQREVQAREGVSQALSDAYNKLIAVEKTYDQLKGKLE